MVESEASYLAQVFRSSRLEVWAEADDSDRALELVVDSAAAEYYARGVLAGRLVIPGEPGVWETITEYPGDVAHLLKLVLPDLARVEITEADPGTLAAQPTAGVRCQQWEGLWFRSGAEVAIAEALDRADVLFAPNASVRLGITQDHRANVEPDFLIVADGEVGVLEVDGPWHTPATAHAEHERDRRFREHGVAVVERFGSDECSGIPDDVVARFLRLLTLNG